MILPVVAFGDSVLKKKAVEIDQNYPKLDELLENMYETMYHANGVGLAAPQIGRSIRLFIIDSNLITKDNEELNEEGRKQIFINPVKLEETGDFWNYNEGCLSIPGVQEDISRQRNVRMRFFDENFKEHEEVFSGVTARVIQHEYDHIEGVLFTDYLKPLKKRLIKRKLTKISKGDVKVGYHMRFPELKGV